MLRCSDECTRLFIDLGVNVNARDADFRKKTALQCAIRCSPELVKLLVEKGANVNGKSMDGRTPLMDAAQLAKVGMTRFLLENGADVNARDTSGQTALMASAERQTFSLGPGDRYRVEDCLEVAKMLIEKGADVNAKNSGIWAKGKTALMQFAVVYNVEAVKLLLDSGADAHATMADGSNALIRLLCGGTNFNDLKALPIFERRDRVSGGNKERPTGYDARRRQVARLLVTHGIDVNARLKGDGSTALAWAVSFGHSELVRLLLQKGATVDAKLNDGRTPLICAVLLGNAELVRLLSYGLSRGGM
ncbi:MAG: ankyrin repeat domain-containing protein [Thermodesulfobacteriota bacterium]